MLSVTHGINQEVSKVKKLCVWLGDKKLFDILHRIAFIDNSLDYRDLETYMPMLYEKLRDKNFRTFFDKRVAVVESIEGL